MKNLEEKILGLLKTDKLFMSGLSSRNYSSINSFVKNFLEGCVQENVSPNDILSEEMIIRLQCISGDAHISSGLLTERLQSFGFEGMEAQAKEDATQTMKRLREDLKTSQKSNDFKEGIFHFKRDVSKFSDFQESFRKGTLLLEDVLLNQPGLVMYNT